MVIIILACIFGRWKAFGYEVGGWGGCARKEVTISQDCKFTMSEAPDIEQNICQTVFQQLHQTISPQNVDDEEMES